MPNQNALDELQRCRADLNKVSAIIDGLGLTTNLVPYLTNYSVIRACGAIEVSFKTIIVDYCSHRSKPQVKSFLNRRIREGSANPSYGNICKLLADFDDRWSVQFKRKINEHPEKGNLMTSLQSLVDARNDFSHGGNPNVSILDVLRYFNHSADIISILDGSVA